MGFTDRKEEKIVIMDVCVKVEGRAQNLIEVRYTWWQNMAVLKCVKPFSIRMVSRFGYGVSSKNAKSNILWLSWSYLFAGVE